MRILIRKHISPGGDSRSLSLQSVSVPQPGLVFDQHSPQQEDVSAGEAGKSQMLQAVFIIGRHSPLDQRVDSAGSGAAELPGTAAYVLGQGANGAEVFLGLLPASSEVP